jgi:hypothetical protein
MELSIYLLFKVDIANLVANKVVICKNFNIQPSELERMPFWEYELTFKECEKLAEEEKRRNEEANNDQDSRGYQRQARDMMGKYGKNVPKPAAMPSMPIMPSFRIPKI